MSFSYMDNEVWERMPGETDKAWLAFALYRDIPLESRTMREAAKLYYERLDIDAEEIVEAKHLGIWANKFNWRYRVRAWDAYVDQAAQAAYIKKRVEAAERQASIGKSLSDIGAMALEEKIARHADPEIPYNLANEKLRDLANIIEVGVKLERTAMGEPIHIEAHEHKHRISGSVDVSVTPHMGLETLNLAELRSMSSMSKKVIGQLPSAQLEEDIEDGEIVSEEDVNKS